MILFMFLLGLLIILGIARYNESEKLFWTLFVSYIGSFAATVAVSEYISNKKQNKVEVVSPAPTQAPLSGSRRCFVLADLIEVVTDEEKSSDPVSKDLAETKHNLVLSKVYVNVRGQPIEPFDTS